MNHHHNLHLDFHLILSIQNFHQYHFKYTQNYPELQNFHLHFVPHLRGNTHLNHNYANCLHSSQNHILNLFLHQNSHNIHLILHFLHYLHLLNHPYHSNWINPMFKDRNKQRSLLLFYNIHNLNFILSFQLETFYCLIKNFMLLK
jgi:hypothetical protein